MLMKKFIIVLHVVFLFACNNQDPQVQTPQALTAIEPKFKILALGDSLTEGLGVSENLAYPAVLEEKLKLLGYQGVAVINAGLSGETTSGLKNRLNWVMKQKPDLTVLNIGANDAMRGLPLDLTRENLTEIIEVIDKNNSEIILGGMQIYDNLGQEYVKGFKDIFPQLASTYKLSLIPFFLDGVAGLAELNQADMIHPNAKGYEIIVNNNILPQVIKKLPASLKKGN